MSDLDASMLVGVDARPYTNLLKEYESTCPACGVTRLCDTGGSAYRGPTRGRMCVGKFRWWRPWGCRLFCRHFHARCTSCGDRWIMAPADVRLFTIQ